MSSPLNFHLEHYEGPLDLLLDLIRKQEINIYDIPIASITAQYLEYVQQALALDIELSAEFVYMAATLIHIKSRMLLPRDPELEKLYPEEDPRQELVERLLEHERFKQAAEMLQQKRLIEENVWSNPQISAFESDDDEPGLAVTMFDLVKTLQQVLERAKSRPTYDVTDEDVSVPEMIQRLKSMLERTPRGTPLSAAEFFERQQNRRTMIAAFLAILEMVKLQAVVLYQKDAFGEILIKRHKRFEEVFASGEAMAAIEKGYS
ncbi:MAG TPA: segregation/condensation protein A [Bryobacteraceae bacterium]|nr:segregation/condensation protein A [Bryobacteraceae bacterium]